LLAAPLQRLLAAGECISVTLELLTTTRQERVLLPQPRQPNCLRRLLLCERLLPGLCRVQLTAQRLVGGLSLCRVQFAAACRRLPALDGLLLVREHLQQRSLCDTTGGPISSPS
jgi:hypothetical protein